MSETSRRRAEEFLKIADQFKLGALVTESSHPVTAKLSDVAKRDIAEALGLLFEVDADVVRKYREFAQSGRAGEIKETLLRALKNGGRIFFTGCGATGRLSIQLDSIWRDFWQKQRRHVLSLSPHEERVGREPESGEAEVNKPPLPDPLLHPMEERGLNRRPDLPADFENRTVSVMAGGDFALIRSVEGFEDFTEFGKKQIGDLGVSAKDVVFAITEGGETSFVIGTAWKGVEVGAKVYFIYNNPDDVLCQHVQRSREVIEDARIEKINLTTGPMAITGSTRMQATSIQLCVMLTVLEMVVRDLVFVSLSPRGTSGERAGERGISDLTLSSPRPSPPSAGGEGVERASAQLDSASVPLQFLASLEEMHATLKSSELLSQLASLVALEESVYRAGRKNNYYADQFGIDVLTDTTERSPTYCTPPFRKFDDATATESWAFLFLPDGGTAQAWERILKREPRCVEWSEDEVRGLVGADKFARTCETVRKISTAELMRFKIGLDGLNHRPLAPGDSAVAIVGEAEKMSLYGPAGFYRTELAAAKAAGAKTGFIFLGSREAAREAGALPSRRNSDCVTVAVPVPQTDFLLDGVTRVGLKMLLNALSTCTMVRLGRVMGNTMIRVVASNLKLIDRATRYIQKLTGLSYEQANHLLFEVIEYVEPRMKADQAYPPVVGLAVMRHREGVGNEEAERRFMAIHAE